MLINSDEINKILNCTDSIIITRGKKYFETSRVDIKNVNIENEHSYDILCVVHGTKNYMVNISKKNNRITTKCSCPYCSNYENIICKHIIASIFDIYTDYEKYYNFVPKNISIDEYIKNVSKENDGLDTAKFSSYLDLHPMFAKKFLTELNEQKTSDIVSYYIAQIDGKEELSKKVSLVPVIQVLNRPYYSQEEFYMYFKIGIDKYYVVKDILDLIKRIDTKENYSYGKALSFNHNINNFDEKSQKLIYSIYHTRKYYDKKSVLISDILIDNLFNIYLNEEIDSNLGKIKFLDEDPKVNILIERVGTSKDKIVVLETYKIIDGLKYSYVYMDNIIYRCSNGFLSNVIPILKEKLKLKNDIIINKESEMPLVNSVLPNIEKYSSVKCEQAIIDKNKLDELKVKVYIDIDEKSNIICDVKYDYGKLVFNPFDSKNKISINVFDEMQYNRLFEELGFQIDLKNSSLIIIDEEKNYNFLRSGINSLIEKCEVNVTDKFKNKQILSPSTMKFQVSASSELLDMEFDNMGLDEKQIKEIFYSYNVKKKYYRLKDGNFIDLSSPAINSMINLSKQLDIAPKELASGKVKLEKYRALYINSVFQENKNIIASVDDEFKKIVNDITNSSNINFSIPKRLNATLRNYQITGFNWLKMLEKYNFGGILADDMGLGKTIQIITLILSNLNSKNNTSIIVCPSSLYLNWQKEFEKFAKDIKVLVISGNTKAREELIKKINSYDVIITSYDILKRDIQLYKEYNFYYIVADEAQYIKNSTTKNSKALKELRGKHRFALTGTPLENYLSELWSIFDFIMPGYLYSYQKFRDKFESVMLRDEKENSEKLKEMIAPFILRRVKKDVLDDLPNKTETIMYNEMNEEQKRVYLAYLYEAKKQLDEEIKSEGFEKSKIKILALITRLRQICCHPSLFLDNYSGESSKLEQCIDVLKDAISSGHKILLFSGFTSMLELIEEKLNKEGIKYYKLTGSTKSYKRLDLVEKFNKFSDVKVFLVSLKAGGTGLNLIGADMVMHFDPWWNLSVENQATDRAYRIGQKNNVQVFKYITKNSIEEKIQEIQNSKKDLFDKVIQKGENFITKMSKEDILKLFSD